MPAIPKVSIGLPVFNGERYVAQTMESLLCQTFEDFEIIISDNGSTDETEAICRSFAERDSRVHFHRCPENRGAAWNFNRVFELSRGSYFKWAAADDVCAPTFLERCVAALEERPSAVLACSDVLCIDEEGQATSTRPIPREVELTEVSKRFRRNAFFEHFCDHVFGVVRSSVLRHTDLIGSYPGSDRILLSHLSLFGPFAIVREPLFLNRNHPERSVRSYPGHSRESWLWFNPSPKGRLLFPLWREFCEYWKVIGRCPLPWTDRFRCYWVVLSWVNRYKGMLFWDLKYYPMRWVIRYVPGGEAVITWLKGIKARLGFGEM